MQISATKTPTDFILSLNADGEKVSAAFNLEQISHLTIDEFLVLLSNRLGGDCICPPGCYDYNIRAKFIVEVDVPWEAEVSEVPSIEVEELVVEEEVVEVVEEESQTPREYLEENGHIASGNPGVI